MGERIGLFASKKDFSFIAFEQLQAMGYRPLVFSFIEKSFPEYPDEIVLEFGDIETFVSVLRENGIKKMVFAGKIEASDLFTKKISISGAKLLSATDSLSPENILKKLCEFLTSQDIEVLPLTEVFKNYLVEEKIYTNVKPDCVQWKDILKGWDTAKSIAEMGIGQALAIKNGMIIAVEGIEGTDRMIARAGQFCKDFVVVKVIKSDQDNRFDLPTIGPETMRILVNSGGKVIALEAAKTIMIKQDQVVQIANQHDLVIVGFSGKEADDC
ncbi:MAG TPA: UDP-2,3-diacylglucosamine diphosphatase LpxI [bacterium]|nr:UDP-2,3-diacylglucosamine diphosphatase LpxI [bacterium]HOL35189.1 UDP-2,3-diacylglucosamine diphosphatase LpxI [bacterium]HPP08586.1 UDP-2,3-diacylglucosamine diphosphatase LpxI [bacterium]